MRWGLVLVALISGLVVMLVLEWDAPKSRSKAIWHQAIVPGELSRSHAFLANQCAVCHTPIKGVEARNCISCHSDNSELLQRQPTAFHANIQTCTGCHLEHQGSGRMPTDMDHALIANLAVKQFRKESSASRLTSEEINEAIKVLEKSSQQSGQPVSAAPPRYDISFKNETRLDDATHAGVESSNLNCAGCHATKDKHNGLFGASCQSCHGVEQWTISSFRHPSLQSTECSQCHLAPPSHNMMHFEMISKSIARQPHAEVNQCYLCHRSTSWNDIKGIGFYKHH
jgi:hypothetical protein